MCIIESFCCIAEINNVVNQLYFSKNILIIKHSVVRFKWVNCLVCELYLNKDFTLRKDKYHLYFKRLVHMFIEDRKTGFL